MLCYRVSPSLETGDDYNQKEVYVVELNDLKKAQVKLEQSEQYDPYKHREVEHPTT